jgi:peroxiredoxin (alkyl hydroperoxide reductase subunit C)|uniref:2-Cys peroxiredoxin n=1 Tax=Coscinodiscus radiatus TaxID=33642 RepID=A0A023HA57_9STRA|nr:2-Cys peroxiredoxin [Coscinodiscus radiatus]YP_009028992.1 2-Cys peroxiredoxin [Coscinodiscus radiatus]AGH28470.1 2-Cys peroxiredoxin [Coscinodiscus radiatus]AGH28536.1 2-Cys peroxiredoxin [Coscinodiscus radiatus]
MINYPQIGKLAPNFITVGVYKKKLGKIRLSDYRGKKYVILVFYPANFTPVSPTELLALSDRIKEFRKLSTQILAISVDSPFCHLRYLISSRDEGGLEGLKYPLISDLRQTITNDYKLLTDDGMALPGLFIIDKEGVIQYYNVNNLLCGRSINEILRILKAIQYIKDNPGHACPVDWNFGDQSLYSHPLKSTLYFKELYSSEKN